MKLSKRVVKILLALILLLFLGAAFSRLASHGIARCYLVKWSKLDNIAPNLYIDPGMPKSQRQVLLLSLADARARVAALYGEYTANPVIIAGHTMEVMRTYGSNSYNRAGRTYLTLATTFIILGPEGSLSTDVLSHELGHAEFSARIGYWNKNEVPNWFDEGLAVQVDDRYSEAEWRARTDNGRVAPALDQIGIMRHDDWLGYATAKHEVRRWLDTVGQEGLWALLQAIRNGDEFQETYHSVEQIHTTTQ